MAHGPLAALRQAFAGSFTRALQAHRQRLSANLARQGFSLAVIPCCKVLEASQCSFNTLIGKAISTLIAGVAGMALDPAPINFVP